MLQHTEQAMAMLIWLDWDADEWGWVKGDTQELSHASSRANLQDVAIDQMHGLLAAHVSSTGEVAGDQISMSLFIDGTAVEVFTSSGKAASTRMYWETPGGLQVSAWSMGGISAAEISAWEMSSIWVADRSQNPDHQHPITDDLTA